LTSTRSYGEEKITFAKKQFEDETRAFGKPREETIFFDQNDSWHLEMQAFVDAIVHDRSIVSGNITDALQVMQCIEAVYRASAAGPRSTIA
jgi:predicted dehydrogenase